MTNPVDRQNLPKEIFRDICNQLVGDLETLLKGTTEVDLDAVITQICDPLGFRLSSICEGFLDQTVDSVIVGIEDGLDSVEICRSVGLRALPPVRHVLKRSVQKYICEVSQSLVGYAWQSGSMDLTELLEQLPGAFGSIWKEVIVPALPELFELLEKGVSLFEVCTTIGLCDGNCNGREKLAGSKLTSSNSVPKGISCDVYQTFAGDLESFLNSTIEPALDALIGELCNPLSYPVNAQCSHFLTQVLDDIIVFPVTFPVFDKDEKGNVGVVFDINKANAALAAFQALTNTGYNFTYNENDQSFRVEKYGLRLRVDIFDADGNVRFDINQLNDLFKYSNQLKLAESDLNLKQDTDGHYSFEFSKNGISFKASLFNEDSTPTADVRLTPEMADTVQKARDAGFIIHVIIDDNLNPIYLVQGGKFNLEMKFSVFHFWEDQPSVWDGDFGIRAHFDNAATLKDGGYNLTIDYDADGKMMWRVSRGGILLDFYVVNEAGELIDVSQINTLFQEMSSRWDNLGTALVMPIIGIIFLGVVGERIVSAVSRKGRKSKTQRDIEKDLDNADRTRKGLHADMARRIQERILFTPNMPFDAAYFESLDFGTRAAAQLEKDFANLVQNERRMAPPFWDPSQPEDENRVTNLDYPDARRVVILRRWLFNNEVDDATIYGIIQNVIDTAGKDENNRAFLWSRLKTALIAKVENVMVEKMKDAQSSQERLDFLNEMPPIEKALVSEG